MMQLKIIGTFDSMTTRPDGTVQMRFKFPYSEIANYSRLLLNLGREAKVLIVNEEDDRTHLGMVSIKQLVIDKDGEAKLTVVGEFSQMDPNGVSMMLERQITFVTKVGGEEELVANVE